MSVTVFKKPVQGEYAIVKTQAMPAKMQVSRKWNDCFFMLS
jgi:hypothetical protein